MSKRISNTEWGLVIGAAIVVDLVQLALDLFLVGIVANRFIDIVIGLTLPFYFKMRGVKMDWKKGGSILITFLLEFVGLGIDALPFWTGDILLIMAFDRAEQKKEESKENVSKPNLSPVKNSTIRQFDPQEAEESNDDMAEAA